MLYGRENCLSLSFVALYLPPPTPTTKTTTTTTTTYFQMDLLKTKILKIVRVKLMFYFVLYYDIKM